MPAAAEPVADATPADAGQSGGPALAPAHAGRRQAASRGTFPVGRRRSRDGRKHPPQVDWTGELNDGRRHDQSAGRGHSQSGHSGGQPRSGGRRSAAAPTGPRTRRAGSPGRDVSRRNRRRRAAADHRRVPPHRADGARSVSLGNRVGQAAGPIRWGRHSCLSPHPAQDRQECLPLLARRRSAAVRIPARGRGRTAGPVCFAANVRRPWPWCFPICRPSEQAKSWPA